jgi:hypothetical protein
MRVVRSPSSSQRTLRSAMPKKQTAGGGGSGSKEGPGKISSHAGTAGGAVSPGSEQDCGATGAAAAGIAAAHAQGAAQEQRLQALEQTCDQLQAAVETLQQQLAARTDQVTALEAELQLVKSSCDKGGSAAFAANTRSERLEVKATSLQSELQEVRSEQQRMQGRYGSEEQREAERSVVVRVPRAVAEAWANRPRPPQGPDGPPAPPRPPAPEGEVRAAATEIAEAATQKAGCGRLQLKQSRPLPGPRRSAASAGDGGEGSSRSNGRGAGDSILVLVALNNAATRSGVLKGASYLAAHPAFSSIYINPALTAAQRLLRSRYLQSAGYQAARAAHKRVVWREAVPWVCGINGALEELPLPAAASGAAGGRA